MGTLFGRHLVQITGLNEIVEIPSLMGTLFGLEDLGLSKYLFSSKYPR